VCPADGTHFSSDVVNGDGIWRGPPDWFSFSSYHEADECPRRWALRRATYPAVWSRAGYPDAPYAATLVGDVVHGALQRIIGALLAAGCPSATSAEAVGALRELGGYTSVLHEVLDQRVTRLSDNPRISQRLDRLRRQLGQRIPEMRQRTQATLSRTEFVAEGGAPSSAESRDGERLADGSYPEFELRSSALGWAGRADLVTIAGSNVHIIDYKTGAPTESHADQLRTYALLWARRDHGDPERACATRLTLSYATHDVNVPAPSASELAALERELSQRTEVLRAELRSPNPSARPSPDNCGYCPVRHMCDAYWPTLVHQAPLGPVDVEIHVLRVNGPHSWIAQLSGSNDEALIRAPDDLGLKAGLRARVLGAYASSGQETQSLTITLTSASEVYALKP